MPEALEEEGALPHGLALRVRGPARKLSLKRGDVTGCVRFSVCV
jgi:hypothetical protein